MLEINVGIDGSITVVSATPTDGAKFAKQLFAIEEPYTVDRRPDGFVVIFSDHFIEAYRKALSINCVADMTKDEKDFYFNFIEWSDGISHSDISDLTYDEVVFKALDTWTKDELLGNEHPEYRTCEG